MPVSATLKYWADGLPYIGEAQDVDAFAIWQDGLPAQSQDDIDYVYLRPFGTERSDDWLSSAGGSPTLASIVQTGSTLDLPIDSTANTGTVSTTITVPADAEIVLVGVSGYQGTTLGLDALTFTKGGVDTAMTKATGGDANTSFSQCALFYLPLPDTGANKTLKWDWVGAGASAAIDFIFCVTFWKGIDIDSPVRDSNGAQAVSTPFTTPTLTCVSGDLVVAFVGTSTVNTAAEGSVDSWSNVTLVTNLVANQVSDAAIATGSPTGNTTVAALTNTNFSDGGIAAIVLKPAPVAALDSVLDETTPSDADFIYVTEPNGDIARINMTSASAIDGDDEVTVKYTLYANVAGVFDVTVRFIQDVTTIATWTHTDVGSTSTLYAQVLTGAERAAVDWDVQTNLKLEFEATT